MIDAHLAAYAWCAAIGVIAGGIVFTAGMAHGVRKEQERHEWEARRRDRENRR